MNKPTEPQPPKLATKFFFLYCSEELKEEIHGDLQERFRDHLEAYGLREARRKYWLNVFKFFRWHTLKPRKKNHRFTQNNNIAMLKNYFKIAWRSALKHKAYSAINLSGLAVGLTSFMLIMIYVQQQLSYDQFHVNKDRIFRVTNGSEAITPNIIAPLLARTFEEEVDKNARVIILGSQIFNLGDKAFTNSVLYADPDFFEMFTFPLLSGTPESALDGPNRLIVSREMAMRHFGKVDVLNEPIKMSGRNYTITGVMEDSPDNSWLQLDFVASFEDLTWARREHWSNWSYHSFLQLSESASTDAFGEKMNDFINEQLEITEEEERETYYLQSLNSIYLQSEMQLDYEMGRVGDIKYVYIFTAVALLILIIACINYINLATSRSLERAKEVGIRKVVGAYRRQLVYQFLGESFLFVFGSLIISVGLSLLLLPYFYELSGVALTSDYLLNMSFIAALVGLGVVISLLAGFYPALMLSTFRPVAVLKGNYKNSGGGNRLRKVLVVFQFAISAFLLVSTLVVNKQLGFIQNRNLGYDREQVLYFRLNNEVRSNFQTLKTELLSNPNIRGISMASNTPLNVGSAHGIKTGPTSDDYKLIYYLNVDEDFIDVMGMDMLSGVGLEERAVPYIELDTIDRQPSMIINETTAALFNWSAEEAIGQRITVSGYEAPVQAVVKDFHFMSMQKKIEPFVLLYDPNGFYYGLVKMGTENATETISHLEKTLSTIAPSLPLEYRFLDDRFDNMYRFESQLSNVFLTFATIAIVIACLGMFGLISFMALNRAKEIGIRKVLGASFTNIIVLLSTDFLRLVSISLLIALPLGYYLMSDWLNDYVYRIAVGADVMVIAVVAALFITCLTISYQAMKTALVNPARILRNE